MYCIMQFVWYETNPVLKYERCGMCVDLRLPLQLLGDDMINYQLRDELDCIIRKVIFKVGKVRFVPFLHNYRYYLVVMQFCPNVLHYDTNPVLKYERCRITQKAISKVRKVQFGHI